MITFIGAQGRLEERVVPAHGFPFRAIRIIGFRRRLSGAALLFPWLLMGALWRSFRMLRQLKPAVVVGTGGFVCGPVLLVAQFLGIPTILQEQNSIPGATTRFLAPRAREVHLTFEESAKHLRRKENVRISGNPTRAALGTVGRTEAAAYFGVHPGAPTLLVFGGSQGAASINAAFRQLAPALAGEGIQVLWQTGTQEAEALRTLMHDVEHAVKVHAFIENMAMAYAAADLAVCRAGASTIAELTRVGLPAVFVPFPGATADHQTANARMVAAAGGGVVVADRDAAAVLPVVVRELLADREKRQAMAEAARRLSKPGATASIADAVLRWVPEACA
jgi:UDP-N-acetylglucosamine--N-acetylmuramyl-(pentapeptide) pyrophosphoryl-undecaprenol N-acetylglucosamine transferase